MDLLRKIEDELLLYRNGSQWFGSITAKLRETQLQPISWWEKYGIGTPHLVSSTSSLKLDYNLFNFMEGFEEKLACFELCWF